MLVNLKNLNEVEESFKKYPTSTYNHYFIIEHPSWDDQHIYYDIYYRTEGESHYGGYLEVGNMINVDEIDIYIEEIKNRFSLPVYEWRKVLVEYGS